MPNLMSTLKSKSKFNCSRCENTFLTLYNLNRHVKRRHPDDDGALLKGKEGRQKCAICSTSCLSMKQLHNHFKEDHPEIELCFQTLTFSTIEDFMKWKRRIELETQSSFIKFTGSKTKSGKTSANYFCHRSGSYESQAKKRRPKIAGSLKTGFFCPAYISLLQEIHDEAVQITVTYQSVHVGHECIIRLPKRKRIRIGKNTVGGKLSREKIEIKNRHQKCKDLTEEIIVTELVRGHSWEIYSNKATGKYLETYKISYEKECVCNIKCDDCNVCIHQFSCTCQDYIVQFTMCEHIHFICQKYFIDKHKNEDNVIEDSVVYENEGNAIYLNDDLSICESDNSIKAEDINLNKAEVHINYESLNENLKQLSEVEKRKALILTDLSSLIAECKSLDQLEVVRKTILDLRTKLCVHNEGAELPPISSNNIVIEPSNQNISTERHFSKSTRCMKQKIIFITKA